MSDEGTAAEAHNPPTLPTLPVDNEGHAAVSLPQGAFPPEQMDEYRVLGLLGQGAMGHVYLAIDTILAREVAIKCITNPGAAHTERFTVEAQAAARVQHPNIAAVYRVGEWAGRPYIVSEYVRGENLGAMPKPVPSKRALELGLAIARGLGAAHRRGVLHRDVKPANIVMSDSGEPKLVDFGLAKLIDASAASGGAINKTPSRPSQHAREQTEEPRFTDPLMSPHETSEGTILGTPYYMAPELWSGEVATARSDVYSLGVLLYELCVGHVPHFSVAFDDLARATQEIEAPSLVGHQNNIDPRLVTIVERCLARDPSRRFASGDEVRQSLEQLSLADRPVSVPDGSPYRGLLAFESEHRSLFFGRELDVRDVVDRLRTENFLVVVGESGVGKSSLVRAGVLPVVVDAGLGDDRAWQEIVMVPGTRPMSTLVHLFSRRLDEEEAALDAELASDPMAVSRRLHTVQGDGAGTIVFIDQLEELVAISDRGQAERACAVLACLAERTPGVRVVATVRVDKIASVASLPGVGHLIQRAIYLLHPMDEHAIKDIIVGPARAKGVRFESDALVDALITGIAEDSGGLPLLQFALSQLWDARDVANNLIRAQSLDDIGGVAGALSRHADGVLDKLTTDTFVAARSILIQLVTAHGTRRRFSERALIHDDDARRGALDALVRGRLVAVHQVEGESSCAIAHEALATSWTTLRHWLDEQGGIRLVKERLALAAQEWTRVDRARDALWRGQRLREASELDLGDVPDIDAAFLRLSRRAELRRRWYVRLSVLVPIAMVIGIYVAFHLIQEWQRADEVNEHVRQAEQSLQVARERETEMSKTRERALAAFHRSAETGAILQGEALWRRTLTLANEADAEYAQATLPLEIAFQTDPGRLDVRRKLAQVLHRRALLAQAFGRDALLDNLRASLAVYDDEGDLSSRWLKSRVVTLTSEPEGLPIVVYRYVRQPDGSLAREQMAGEWATPARWSLHAGSYLFVIPETATTSGVRYPYVIEAGTDSTLESRSLHLEVPPARAIPQGFIYVAPGVFLFGYGKGHQTEEVRPWYQTLPLHERRTGGFLIARHETTYGDWMAFLRDLSANERKARMPSVNTDTTYDDGMVHLEQVEGQFVLTVGNSRGTQHVAEGDWVTYPARDHRQRQDWRRFPVTGISAQDAQAYVAWLGATGRVPGARLCREDEWERAARGADGRMFSHGDDLKPEDANYDRTYGRDPATMGVDEVGTYIASESPFGLLDAIGNAREMTISVFDSGARVVLRNGSYFRDRITNSLPNREALLEDQRFPQVGLRVCADWPVED